MKMKIKNPVDLDPEKNWVQAPCVSVCVERVRVCV
jgi:hypothetical protein